MKLTVTHLFTIKAGGGIYLDNGSLLSYYDSGIGYRPSNYPNSVTNGNGGGIFAKNSSITLRDETRIANNYASGNGGGAYLTNCIMTCYNNAEIGDGSYHGENFADGNGGGIFAIDSTISLTNVKVSAGNAGIDGGGAINVNDSILTITNSVFEKNIAIESGGAIHVPMGSTVTKIFESSFLTNSAGDSGGAILWYRVPEMYIRNSVINANESANDGGGINIVSSSVIRNCLIAKNYAKRDGGGIYNSYDSLVQNCTICSNAANVSGGGINGYKGTNINNIVYYNFPDNFSNYFTHSINKFNCTYPELFGDNNIINEPNFIDYQNGDYRLHHASSCFNAGTNETWMIDARDLSHQDRIIDGTVDIGAYELGELFCEFNAFPNFGMPPLTVKFHSIVSETNVVNVFFFWDFDNNGTYDETGLWQDVTQFVYTNPGTYSVSLTVSNAASEIANITIEKYIEVIPEPTIFLIFSLGFWILRRKFKN